MMSSVIADLIAIEDQKFIDFVNEAITSLRVAPAASERLSCGIVNRREQPVTAVARLRAILKSEAAFATMDWENSVKWYKNESTVRRKRKRSSKPSSQE